MNGASAAGKGCHDDENRRATKLLSTKARRLRGRWPSDSRHHNKIFELSRALLLVVVLTTFALISRAANSPPTQPDNHPTIIVVQGDQGSPEFAPVFIQSADRWAAAAKLAHADFILIGRDPLSTPPATQSGNANLPIRPTVEATPATTPSTEPATAPTPENAEDKTRLRLTLAAEIAEPSRPLWLVLLGHGTFDGHDAKFNLRGEDFSDTELAQWLRPCVRPLAVIDCSSASAPFLNRLSGKNRVIITATRSGSEIQYSRFGDYISSSIADPAADLDKDGQTSLLEAFLTASSRTAEFYKREGRLATEHSLLDDNGDGLGISADWFDGLRPTHAARNGAPLDGPYANQWHLIPSGRRTIPHPRTAHRQTTNRIPNRIPPRTTQKNHHERRRLLHPTRFAPTHPR